jgi:putative acetyltransferase
MNDDDERRARFFALAVLPPAARDPIVATVEATPAQCRSSQLRRLRGIIDFDFAHLVEIADLWVASWQRTMPSIDFEGRREWFCVHLDEALRKGTRIRVAVAAAGDVVGFVTIDPATGWLDQIAVRPDWWGSDAAAALIAAAREISPRLVRLDVNADNPRAIAFYRRQGFEETGRGTNPRSGLPTIALEWRPRR